MDEERLARDRARRAAAEELTALVLEQLFPTMHRLQLETAMRLGLTAADLVCLDLLRRHGPLTSELIADRTGLGRSAVSKMVRRLKRAGHVERSEDPAHLQRVRVTLVPHDDRDFWAGLVRSDVCADLVGAAATARLERPQALAELTGVLRTLISSLHRAAIGAGTTRWARHRAAERRRRRPVRLPVAHDSDDAG